MSDIKEAYKQAMDKITPRDELIERTITKMQNDINEKPTAKNGNVKRVALIAASFLVIGVAGIAALRSYLLPGNNTAAKNSDKIILIENYVEAPAAKLFFDPASTHEEAWDEQQMLNFLGKDPRPAEVPEDLKAIASNEYYVILNNDGTMAFGNFIFSYDNEEYEDMAKARSVTVIVSKDALSPTCVKYLDDELTRSVISNVSVAMTKTEQQIFGADGNPSGSVPEYKAEFLTSGLAYRVFGANITQDEFVGVISSIIASASQK